MKNRAIILAAGKGTRMKSELPKVLHKVSGKAMLQHLIDKLNKIHVDEIVVVVGHKSEIVREHIKTANVLFVEQTVQNGTAHAVLQVKELLGEKEGRTLVLTGDTPLIEEETLTDLLAYHKSQNTKGTVLTTIQENPTGYGRIVRKDGKYQVEKIVEEKDANSEEKAIKEVNTGIFCFDNQTLFKGLPLIQNNNSQQEYYLTDIIEVYSQMNEGFEAFTLQNPEEVMGINDRVQLAEAERVMREKINYQHMVNGVTLIDPSSTFIESDVVIGQDTIIYPNVTLTGNTKVGKNVVIHSGTEIHNSVIGDKTVIKSSYIDNAEIMEKVTIGPFAHIRPSTVIKNNAKVGNFVELKNTVMGEGSKANHLTYLGDSEVGSGVNIGCGTITVNYDGKNKHKTTIEDGAFVGCNANLMAPVTIGKNSIVAAGSTITEDVPKNSLGIAREKQTNKAGYASIIKQRNEEIYQSKKSKRA